MVQSPNLEINEMESWDKLGEECGIFSIVAHPEAARLAYLGLYALQHRGQESAGIVCSDRKRLYLERPEPSTQIGSSGRSESRCSLL